MLAANEASYLLHCFSQHVWKAQTSDTHASHAFLHYSLAMYLSHLRQSLNLFSHQLCLNIIHWFHCARFWMTLLKVKEGKAHNVQPYKESILVSYCFLGIKGIRASPVASACCSLTGMLAEAVSSQIFPLLLLVASKGRSESNSICMYLCLQSKSCSSVSSPMWVWRQPSLFSVHHKKAQRAVMDTKIAISLLILAFMGNFPGKKIEFIFLYISILLQYDWTKQYFQGV